MPQTKTKKRFLLICCEGKTEKEYFAILRRLYRLPGARVVILGEKGQHKALVDRTVSERKLFCEKDNIDPSDVECWAVCDDDGMSLSYAELLRYSEEHDVRLAFSRPQFEAFLLQHFEQSGEHDQKRLYAKLGEYATQYCGITVEYEKSNLDWMADVLDTRPKLVRVAVTNADQRKKQSARVFLTVQDLVKRMRELGK